MPPTDEVAARLVKTIRHVALALMGAALLLFSLLVVGFGGPVVLVFHLWLLALIAAVWRLVRARLSFETYALVVMGTLTALILLSAFLGPAMASASSAAAGTWLLLALFVLPLALWIWLAVGRSARLAGIRREEVFEQAAALVREPAASILREYAREAPQETDRVIEELGDLEVRDGEGFGYRTDLSKTGWL